jgi:hypothetical protein
MSSSSETKEPSSILIEFVREEDVEYDDEEAEEPGEPEEGRLRQWFKKDKTSLEKKSEVAIDKAMKTIKEMSDRVSSTIENLQNRPNSVEVGFGIKFDAAFDVMVAKVGTEASMTVMLKWEMEKAK